MFKSLFSKMFFSKKKFRDNFYPIIKKLEFHSKKMTVDEKKIFTNLLEFGHKTVEEIMIPRSDIKAIELATNLNELKKIFSSNVSHTRTLVYNETLDDIVGFIHIKDLFKMIVSEQNISLKKIIHEPIISAPSIKLIDLLAEMRMQQVPISVIVDEYGCTDGMVTIEDIMEEIVGRIDDEHDQKSEKDSFKIINKNTIISNARVEVADLEEALGVNLKTADDEFDTIGGLVLAKIGHVPLIGTKIDIEELVELEVIDANPRSLKLVRLKLKNGSIATR